jgi:predicted MFS family arabinose efflux permease
MTTPHTPKTQNLSTEEAARRDLLHKARAGAAASIDRKPDGAMPQSATAEGRAHWSGVFAMSVCVFALIASEFMPVSLLTPVAADLGVSEGRAGQAISVSAAFALLTSLSISSLARNLDRKVLLLWMTLMMLVSAGVIAMAPNYAVYMFGRVLIGVSVGGFWSMSAATAMRLVPAPEVPRALAIFNGGNALATMVAAPLGSYLGSIVGWRGAFFCLVPVALVAFVWQWLSLPAMNTRTRTQGSAGVLKLLRDSRVALGMSAVAAFFMGQFALFTYLRPFLETVTGVGVSTLSLILLATGVAGLIGTTLIGKVAKQRLYPALVAIPLIMALIALALIAFGSSTAAVALLLAVWGLVGTAAPVGWWTWVASTMPESAEAGGGLMVAVVQLAIGAGSAAGGLLFDMSGYATTFGVSALLLLVAGLLAFLSARMSRSGCAGHIP